MVHRLYTTSARPDEHVAELIHRIRGLDDAVSIVRLTPMQGERASVPEDAPPPPEHDPQDLPLLVDNAGAVIASGGGVVLALDGMDAEVDAIRRKDDDAAIDRLRELLRRLNTAGFAYDRETYEPAYRDAFERLDALERELSTTRYLSGQHDPSLADLWLFALLVRFEVVYYGLYKCNRYRVRDRAELGGFLRDMYQRPGFADSVNWDAIKRAHYWEDARINPKLTVPLGVPDLWDPHDRAERFDREEFAQVGIEEKANTIHARGEWVRPQSGHRHRVTSDGSSGFPAEAGRYHIYVSNNCPWCHRVSLTRSIKGLTDVISLDVLYYRRHPELGWQFNPDEPGCTPDRLFGHKYIKELYDRVGSHETSVPILFDTQTETIVSNESAEIVRMLDQGFHGLATREIELYPAESAAQIDRYNAWIYTDINNGAYKAGFTGSQAAYELSYHRFFSALGRLEQLFEERRFLCGDRLTEADVRLFPTMFRFDHVYYTRFRLDQARVRDYPNLFRWLREVVHYPGVAEASNLDHCKKGYFGRNANNIVPLGPDLDFEP